MEKIAKKLSEPLTDGMYYEYDDADQDAVASLAKLKKGLEPRNAFVDALPAAAVAGGVGGLGSLALSRGDLAAGAVGGIASFLGTLVLNSAFSGSRPVNIYDALANAGELPGNWKLTDKPRKMPKKASDDGVSTLRPTRPPITTTTKTTVKLPTVTTHEWKRGYAPEALGGAGVLIGGTVGALSGDKQDTAIKRLAKILAGAAIGGLAGYGGGFGLTEIARKDLQA